MALGFDMVERLVYAPGTSRKSVSPHCLSGNEFPQNTSLRTSHWLKPKPIQNYL